MPAYLTALLITVCLEVAVVAAMAHRWRSLTFTSLAAACVALNLLTHPSANLLRIVFSTPILPLEAAVVLVEAIGYRVICQLPISKSFTISLLANSLSMLVGVIAYWKP